MNRLFFHSSSFRLLFYYTILFVLAVSVLSLSFYLVVTESLEGQIENHILNDTEQLMIDYRDDGIEELRHDVEERITADQNVSQRLYYSILRPDGDLEFDQLESIPKRNGWYEFVDSNDDNILLYRVDINDGYSLIVGLDSTHLYKLEKQLKRSLIFFVIFIIITGTIGAYWLSKKFFAQLGELKKVTQKIGEGELSQRVPLLGKNDEFDQLAEIINEMLTRIEQLVGEVKNVSANISHDLRTPLGRLRQELEQIQNSSNVSKEVDQSIEKAIHDLDNILLTFSSLLRISELKTTNKAKLEVVSLGELAENMKEIYVPIFEERGASLRLTIEDSFCEIMADKTLFNQMLVNVLENALIHNDAKVDVQLRVFKEKGRTCLSVCDNGAGIAENEREEIFKAFYRIDKSRSKPGNGLGLSLVQVIAKLHKCELEVSSHLPQGTCFTFRFPTR